MRPIFRVFVIPDDSNGQYSAGDIRELLKAAELQGHPLEPGSYLEQLTVRQLDALVHGRTDT